MCHMPPGVSLSRESGNFDLPYIMLRPTFSPALTCMSVETLPGSSSEEICPSTSSLESVTDHRDSLHNQEVHDQLRKFRHMLEGLEHKLDQDYHDLPWPRQLVAAPSGFTTLPLAEYRRSSAVQATVASPAPLWESSLLPPAPFTMGRSRQQRAAATSGPVATVTQSYLAVTFVAPDEPQVFTTVTLPSGTTTEALPGWPQVSLWEGFYSSEPDSLCGYPSSG